MALELVCEIDLADGTERFSLGGVSGATKFYEPRIVEFGDFSVEVPAIPGEARLSDTSVVLDDTDRRFTKSKAANAYKNVKFRWLIGDLSRGESALTEIYNGRISNFSAGRGRFTLTVTQDSFPKFSTALAGKMSKATFPDLPDETKLKLVPWVAGTVSSVGLSNSGAMPAYRIDPAASQSKYRYVAAQGDIKEITNVYKYGAIQTSGITKTTAAYGGETYAVIDFTVDPLDAARRNEFEVTWDGVGVTDSGASSGVAITNPAKQIEAFLLNNGFVAADIDSTAMSAAETLFSNRGMAGGVCIVGDGSEDVRSIVERFTASFNMYVYPSKAGKLAVSTIDNPAADTSALQAITEAEIVLGGFSFRGTKEYASRIYYNFSKNHALSEFEDRSNFEDTAQSTKFGGEVQADPLQLDFVRLSHVASAVARDRLFFMAEERVVIDLHVSSKRYNEFKIADQVLLTHRGGLSTDQKGFNGTIAQVIGYGITMGGQNSFMLTLKLVDLIEASFQPDGFGFELPQMYSNILTDLENYPSSLGAVSKFGAQTQHPIAFS